MMFPDGAMVTGSPRCSVIVSDAHDVTVLRENRSVQSWFGEDLLARLSQCIREHVANISL